jgi:probable phosphomutase (TIGR03848 family)
MTLLYLIRHAENEQLKKGRLVGWKPGVHLNERGIMQAQALGKLLRKANFKAIYASPLERTMETARFIAKAQSLEVVAREGLGEIHFGTWQGYTFKALRRRKLWPVIQKTPSLAKFPKGESISGAQARIVGELDELRARHHQRKAAFACVSHADMIKLAVAHYIGLPLDMYQRLAVEPASITVLAIGESQIKLLSFNDTTASRQIKGE